MGRRVMRGDEAVRRKLVEVGQPVTVVKSTGAHFVDGEAYEIIKIDYDDPSILLSTPGLGYGSHWCVDTQIEICGTARDRRLLLLEERK